MEGWKSQLLDTLTFTFYILQKLRMSFYCTLDAIAKFSVGLFMVSAFWFFMEMNLGTE